MLNTISIPYVLEYYVVFSFNTARCVVECGPMWLAPHCQIHHPNTLTEKHTSLHFEYMIEYLTNVVKHSQERMGAILYQLKENIAMK